MFGEEKSHEVLNLVNKVCAKPQKYNIYQEVPYEKYQVSQCNNQYVTFLTPSPIFPVIFIKFYILCITEHPNKTQD
jgi:hypothetical protein